MFSENVHVVNLQGREIILVGTAHVSRKSAEEVKQIIESETPDVVCIELCPQRYQSITDRDRWKNTNIVKIIKDGKSILLLANLVVSSYQKKLAAKFGVNPGQEMIQGIESAEKVGAEICLADRDLQVTMRRLWKKLGAWGKIKLFFQVLAGILLNEELSEEDMEKIKKKDMLSAALDELSSSFPRLKEVVIDERDSYLAQKIKNAGGSKVVAVLGAGHVPGIKQALREDKEINLAELSAVPVSSKVARTAAWIIPLLIIAAIAATFSVDRATGIDQVVSWLLWNGSLAVIGALLAFAHPLSILTAFLVSPISSLSPLLAAGWFAGLVEALIRKPSVQDFESLPEDIQTVKGFWRNKVTHVLIVVALANLGSTAGSIIGGAEVIRRFISTFFG